MAEEMQGLVQHPIDAHRVVDYDHRSRSELCTQPGDALIIHRRIQSLFSRHDQSRGSSSRHDGLDLATVRNAAAMNVNQFPEGGAERQLIVTRPVDMPR